MKLAPQIMRCKRTFMYMFTLGIFLRFEGIFGM
jgi:hypothetical protein